MKKETIGSILIIAVLSALFLCGSVLADKATAMRRKKAAEKDKYQEFLIMHWPEAGQWKAEKISGANPTNITFFYPKGQSSNDWKEMGSVESKPLDAPANLNGIARMIYLGTKQGSPNAEWKVLYKGQDDSGYNYIVFQIHCPDFLSGEQPQIQFWKIIAGNQNLYTVQYSYRDDTIPEEKQLAILEQINNAHIELKEKETPPPDKSEK